MNEPETLDEIVALHQAARVLNQHAEKLRRALMRGARNTEHREHLHRTIKGFFSAERHCELLAAHLTRQTTTQEPRP